MSLFRRLASQSAIIFMARIFGAGLIFLAQAGIARFWGAELLGEYVLIIATMNLLAMVIPLGFQTVGTYFTAEYSAKNDRAMLWRFLRRSYGHIVVIGALVIAFCGPVASLFGEPGQVVAKLALPTAILATATAIGFLNGALLVGLRRPFVGFLSETLFRPFLVIAAFAIAAAFTGGQGGLSTMLWILACSYFVVVLAQFWLVVLSVRQLESRVPERPSDGRRWWRFAVPWVLIVLATDFFFDIDLILLSGQMDRGELAVFGICARLFALASFGVSAVYAVTLPDVFEAEIKSDRAEFIAKIGEANLVASGVAIVLVVGVLAGGGFALSIFGPDFVAGAWPLAILCLGLLVRALFGPASVVLSIHDQPYASLPAIGCGLVSLVFLNLWLVPGYGLMGAAMAALLAIILWSAALWLTARVVVGVDVSILSGLRRLRNARTGAFKP